MMTLIWQIFAVLGLVAAAVLAGCGGGTAIRSSAVALREKLRQRRVKAAEVAEARKFAPDEPVEEPRTIREHLAAGVQWAKREGTEGLRREGIAILGEGMQKAERSLAALRKRMGQ